MKAALLLAALSLAGCERAMHHMYDQPRLQPLEASTLFADGGASQPPVAGTVPHARGTLAGTSSGREGAQQELQRRRDEQATRNPYPPTAALLARGRQRFDIYCTPCHSVLGDGDGYVVRRGFPAPPSFHDDRLRDAPDRHFYDVITLGHGVMYPYADRIAPADRWAIVAYIRALQLSQHARVRELPASLQRQLEGAP